METRRDALQSLAAGDIFHAVRPDHPGMLCLVTSVAGATIEARTIPTRISLRFDRTTGVANWHYRGHEMPPARIDSIAPLPSEIYNALVGLDHKYQRLLTDAELRLTPEERRALLFIKSFYTAHQL